MPRSSEEAVGRVRALLKRRTNGATSNEVAKALDVPERTARRYLARLFAHHEVTRVAEYSAEPSVTFHYRYRCKE